MIDIALEDGDLKIENLDATLVRDAAQIVQNLSIRLKFFLGEWYLDITQGIPFFEYFFVKAPNQIQVDSFLKNEISSTDGVEQITSFENVYNAIERTYDVNFSALAMNQIIQVNVVVP